MKSLALLHLKRFRSISSVLAVVCLVMLIALVSGSIWIKDGNSFEAALDVWDKAEWQVAAFLILAFALFLAVRKLASRTLNNHIDGISSELEDLKHRKAGIEKQIAEYNRRLACLDREAEQIISEYIRQGEEAKEHILRVAQNSAEKFEAQAQTSIESELNQARIAIQKAVTEMALAKSEEINKSRISGDDQERLNNEYSNKVVV